MIAALAVAHVHRYETLVVLSGAQTCHGATAYSRVTVGFVGPSPYPKSKPADFVYPARCR